MFCDGASSYFQVRGTTNQLKLGTESAVVTLNAPAPASNRTLTLPTAASGTIALTSDIPGKNLCYGKVVGEEVKTDAYIVADYASSLNLADSYFTVIDNDSIKVLVEGWYRVHYTQYTIVSTTARQMLVAIAKNNVVDTTTVITSALALINSCSGFAIMQFAVDDVVEVTSKPAVAGAITYDMNAHITVEYISALIA